MLLVFSLKVGWLWCAIYLKFVVADVASTSESSFKFFLPAVRTNSSAGSTLIIPGKHIHMCWGLNPHCFPVVEIVINLIRVYLPSQRIRYQRLGDHPQNRSWSTRRHMWRWSYFCWNDGGWHRYLLSWPWQFLCAAWSAKAPGFCEHISKHLGCLGWTKKF